VFALSNNSGAQLDGLAWDHPRAIAPLRATAGDWQLQAGVRVAWHARSLQEFADQPLEDVVERYDLVVFDHPHVGLAAEAGLLTPLDAHLDPAFLEDQAGASVGPSHRSYAWQGHQWGLAIDAAGHVSAYRPDLLEALGVGIPATWEDAVSLAERAARRGWSIGLPAVPVDCLMSFLSLCANAGAEPFASPDVAVERGAGREALTRLRDLFDLAHPAARAENPIAVLDRMATGSDVPYCPLLFGYSNYARAGFRDNLVRFAPLPSAGRGRTGGILGGAGIGVSANSRSITAAAAYAAYVAAGPVQRGAYVRAGGQPGHRSAWTDPAANALTHGFFSETLGALDSAYLRPRDRGFVATQTRGGELLHDFLVGEDRDPAGVLDALDALHRDGISA
jgi:multiple sugar transport system substrate-binding protein